MISAPRAIGRNAESDGLRPKYASDMLHKRVSVEFKQAFVDPVQAAALPSCEDKALDRIFAGNRVQIVVYTQ